MRYYEDYCLPISKILLTKVNNEISFGKPIVVKSETWYKKRKVS